LEVVSLDVGLTSKLSYDVVMHTAPDNSLYSWIGNHSERYNFSNWPYKLILHNYILYCTEVVANLKTCGWACISNEGKYLLRK